MKLNNMYGIMYRIPCVGCGMVVCENTLCPVLDVLCPVAGCLVQFVECPFYILNLDFFTGQA